MIEFNSLEDISLLSESVSIECKLARGRDGKGAVPDSFWQTYSAFANTDGGVVLFGLGEDGGRFTVEGIETPERLRTELFNNLNNRQKVSFNLISDAHIREQKIDGKTILIVEVPRAKRKHRPVYLKSNPLGGNTYRRLNEADCALTDDEVKRMLAEQVEESRDSRILFGYNLDDLNHETLRAYRQAFSSRSPTHVWNGFEDQEFLRNLGAWRFDRDSGRGGLTLAGLLMFGEMTSIQEELAYYRLDYQERPESKSESRWLDRVSLDGTWSGNLYDFYRIVYHKLTSDLKVPFLLENGIRKDESPVHVALREALVNTLVHADYSERASVLIVKRPDMFGFRNPGLMRIPVEVALKGGESDCRNRNLQKMFRFVGLGEEAGSGIPKILDSWKSQHWVLPKLHESSKPYDQTLLELRMIDLLPSDIINSLRKLFGDTFDKLGNDERMALALASAERTVNHARLCELSATHPADITRILRGLTQKNMLDSQGNGRATVYFLKGQAILTPEVVFGSPPEARSTSSSVLGTSSSVLSASSSVLSASSSVLSASSSVLTAQRDEEGRLLSDKLPLPVINDLETLSPSFRSHLEQLAEAPRKKKRLTREVMRATIEKVCQGHYLTLHALANVLRRDKTALRNEYLTPMVSSDVLRLAFSDTPTHQEQAYTANTKEGTSPHAP